MLCPKRDAPKAFNGVIGSGCDFEPGEGGFGTTVIGYIPTVNP
ncbi:hypothetical protein MC7420_6769 [Coleofasciculus chthonoplastes PCC 7420]|uniref:Uncharacterized protein n=1 Tax=Coleofasciculus chthonoplastes PCC 7420 TaxID=118168 RepID=B4VWL0_9CYAN|nr:hypothetical protein MC7420_6769 [Coleofasciculus chthonoplastes PCC 7420]